MTHGTALNHQINRVINLTDQLDTMAPAEYVLADLRQLRDQVNRAIDHTIVFAREGGMHWPAMAAALKVSPTAVAKRHEALTERLPRNR